MAASPIKLGPRGDLPRPGSSGVQLPSLDGQEQQVGRKFAPPAGVPRPPFNTAYPPPRPDFDAMDDDADPPPSGGGVASNPGGLEPEPESFPGGVMAEEAAPPAKPTMERKGKPKAAARPRSPEFKVHRDEVEEILEKPRYTAGWYRKADRITEENIKTGYGVSAEAADEAAGGDGDDDGDGIKLPGERPVSPEARETWSLVYQEPHAMMDDLRDFGDVNAADRAGWTALHWAALLGKEGHVRLLLDSEASIRASSIISVGRDVRAPNEAQVRRPSLERLLNCPLTALSVLISRRVLAACAATGRGADCKGRDPSGRRCGRHGSHRLDESRREDRRDRGVNIRAARDGPHLDPCVAAIRGVGVGAAGGDSEVGGPRGGAG